MSDTIWNRQTKTGKPQYLGNPYPAKVLTLEGEAADLALQIAVRNHWTLGQAGHFLVDITLEWFAKKHPEEWAKVQEEVYGTKP
jgi:hypothetical protein